MYMEGVNTHRAKLVDLLRKCVAPVVTPEGPSDMVNGQSVYLAVKTVVRLVNVLLTERKQALQCLYCVIGFLLCLLCGG